MCFPSDFIYAIMLTFKNFLQLRQNTVKYVVIANTLSQVS